MKLPLSWLRECVEWPAGWSAVELAHRLTMAGFEVEAIEPAAPAFAGVVVGRIVDAQRHPKADKLQVCRVVIDPLVARDSVAGTDVSAVPALQIVCGASNARAGLVTAVALVGAQLPGEVRIEAATLRGVESAGMLCSARELGIGEGGEGIVELDANTPIGVDLRQALALDDTVLDINVTPNRGDAMSVLGIARELAVIAGSEVRLPAVGALSEGGGPEITLTPGAGAARYVAARLQGVDNTRVSPLWLRERLRRAGVRSISPVVDATNYVLLEQGTPMHAYDAAKLSGGLTARRARAGERLVLLDGTEITLDPEVLVIAHSGGEPVGLAGIFGGARTAIEVATRDVVLEAAWFSPASIAGRARRYGLQTDAGQRFERGVDPRAQERAMARAIELIQAIAGGTLAGVSRTELPGELPVPPAVTVRKARIERLLGAAVADAQVEQRLRGLGMQLTRAGEGWRAVPPSWRFDIAIEADLIEEVGRLGGLDRIPEQDRPVPARMRAPDAGIVDDEIVLRTLAARGYQEAVTFGFVDPVLQRRLCGEAAEVELANPIASDLAVMRRSLLPGLLSAARENLRRQQSRVRLMEIAARFERVDDGVREYKMLAGLALGSRLPEQWGSKSAMVDFFDVKADVEAVLALAGEDVTIRFEAGGPACLHPGRSARILRHEAEGVRTLGYIGELHPELQRECDLAVAPLVFELDFNSSFQHKTSIFKEISKFPQVRRDLSVTVPSGVSFADVRERVTVAAGRELRELRLFDLYQGKGIESNRKSIALGLIFQGFSRTLTDADADRSVAAVLVDLQQSLEAKLRE